MVYCVGSHAHDVLVVGDVLRVVDPVGHPVDDLVGVGDVLYRLGPVGRPGDAVEVAEGCVGDGVGADGVVVLADEHGVLLGGALLAIRLLLCQ